MELIADISATAPPPPESKASPPTVIGARAAPPGATILQAKPGSGPVVKVESAVSSLPSIESILDKYLEASGGKAAFDKITSRVSTGAVEITALNVTGTVELSEQAPGKSSLQIHAPGLGIIQSTFDGSRAWLQDPLQGFISFTGIGLEAAKAGAIFNKQVSLKELYPEAVLVGKEKLGGQDTMFCAWGSKNGTSTLPAGCFCAGGIPTSRIIVKLTASSCPSKCAMIFSPELA